MRGLVNQATYDLVFIQCSTSVFSVHNEDIYILNRVRGFVRAKYIQITYIQDLIQIVIINIAVWHPVNELPGGDASAGGKYKGGLHAISKP